MEEKKNIRPRRDFKEKKYEEKVIYINRVSNVVKGGRKFSFSALVAVGNRKGLVGIGMGKAKEVPDAIKKAVEAATKNIKTISIVDNRTIPHEAIGVAGASRVLLKPAAKGTGIIAGGPVRDILELAGVHDILSKSLGSNTKVNVAKAVMKALECQRSAEEIAKLRSKTVEEIIS